jgi:site-specific DNA recombinase
MQTLTSTAQISWEYMRMKRKERAAGYPRVSDENLKDSPTLDSQEKAIREYIEQHGYDFEEKHMYPEAMTAYLKPYHERPIFMEVITAAKRREYDVLVVTEYSRLSRRQIEQAIIIDLLQKYGVRVESITENFDDSPIGIFMRNVFAFIAEVEREKTFWRTARGMRDRIITGQVLSGRGAPMYGYQWVDTNDYSRAYYELNLEIICVIDGEAWTEVKVVVYIFDLTLSGHSIKAIARRLTDLGIPTRRGKLYWQPGTVGHILANEAYTGIARGFRWKRDAKKGKNGYSVHRPEEEQIALPDGVIPRIIDPDVFKTVSEQLARNKAEAARNNKWPKDVLLRGRVRCGVCNAKLRIKNQHGGDHGQLRLNRYLCDKQIGVVKHSVNIGAKTLDSAAWDFAMEYIINPCLIRERVEELRKQARVVIDAESVEKIVTGIRKKLRNLSLLAQESTDDDTLDSIKALMHDLERQKHEAEGMLFEVVEEEEKMKEINTEIDRFEAWAKTVRQFFLDPEYVPSYDEKILAVKILGVQAKVYPVDAPKRYELTVGPPSIVSLLCG